MENVFLKHGINVNFVRPPAVIESDIRLIEENASVISKKAMELTDSWAGVMFVLSQEVVENVATAVGFDISVAKNIHKEIKKLRYATTESQATFNEPLATWHAIDATLLVLRGATNLDHALSDFSNENIQSILDAHQDVFQRIREALPGYTAQMNFNPETASAVLRSFGADISSDMLYALSSKYGTTSCVDLEGRRGVSSDFIRCVTLTLAYALS